MAFKSKLIKQITVSAVALTILTAQTVPSFAAITEAGFDDYCVVGGSGDSSSEVTGDKNAAGKITVKIKGIDPDLSPAKAAKEVAKAVGKALDDEPSLIYGQLVQESGSQFNSSLARNEHNLSGMNYGSYMSEIAKAGSVPSDGTGGLYANFNDWNGYASAYASLLKSMGVTGKKDAASYVHQLKHNSVGQYFTADEGQYLRGLTAGAALYFGKTATGDDAAVSDSSSDGSGNGSWRKGNDDFPPDSLDTAWTQGFGDAVEKPKTSDVKTDGEEEKRAKQVFDFLVEKMGFSGAGAAAFLGNFEIESHFDPMASNGSHFGIAQWTQSRLDRMNLKANDPTSMTLENELKLVQAELDGPYKAVKAKVGNATDVTEATSIVNNEYEVSGNAAEADREANAKKWYEKFNGASISANPALLGATATADSGATTSSSDSSSSQNGACSGNSEASSGEWGWPFKKLKKLEDAFKNLDGPTSEQAFGKSPSRTGGFHDGWDFGDAKYGQGSDILAIHGGTVYKIEEGGGRGWHVDVKSDDGYFETYQEAFASRDSIKVKEGEKINVGDVIGKMDGPLHHTHIGVSKTEIEKAQSSWNKNDGTWLNPVRVLAGDGNSTTDDYGKTAP